MKGIVVFVPILISLVALAFSCRADQRATELFKIQHTPRLTVTTGTGAVVVGPMPGRQDPIVEVPMFVFNGSEAFAYDVTLDLLYWDGTGRSGSLNDYFRGIGAPIMQQRTMAKAGLWVVGSRAISAEKREKYQSRDLQFKVQLQLSWKDAEGKEYRFIELAELKYVPPIEGYQGRFWFDSKGSYSSLDDPAKVEEYWKPPMR
ncbi:MAG: hypothetical protein A3B73_04425 [Omnitrophica WOR_2 bacterium RIFCSPHIGHO2_02_FULL_63_39]|nr:MAG: hypothetical protein A3B73_04425 [Omnitrophica WOR_2 bacterium RIFCSPHIGHO2_02_FULL_63_39]OGX48767.1 MAG: hypothetical protein A3G88_05945 [Omnitrophica WOR_2 bacterium RIFCSPLOWO2_12_FULL_63_16]